MLWRVEPNLLVKKNDVFLLSSDKKIMKETFSLEEEQS